MDGKQWDGCSRRGRAPEAIRYQKALDEWCTLGDVISALEKRLETLARELEAARRVYPHDAHPNGPAESTDVSQQEYPTQNIGLTRENDDNADGQQQHLRQRG